MATIVRIKRSLCEEPLDAVVINCKKRKVEIQNENEHSAVFRFIGTTKTQEEDVFKHIKSTKAIAEEKYKKHISNITEKLREQAVSASKNSRYKIINCQRLKDENTSTSSLVKEEEPQFTIYDIENEKGDNNLSETNADSYLYDLYYAHWDEFQKGVEDNELISVYPLSDQLIYGSYRDNGINERYTDESEDSNDENNWRNDYPDESDMESVTEDDMLNAVNKITLNHENSLSSDDDEEDIYNDNGVEKTDIDTDEADRYGKMYARFKARVRKEDNVNKELYYGDIEDGDDDYY